MSLVPKLVSALKQVENKILADKVGYLEADALVDKCLKP